MPPIGPITTHEREATAHEKTPEKPGFKADCHPMTSDDQKPLGRFELPTYALRMRRSAS